ncbi:Macrolide-efflux protein [Staphylococcus aureus]|nr:Macrolide-efflux protein [Staphylococcus aureus]SGU60149.1 Macrolide-efflux protein [Staphylococcus aureus]
MLYLEVLKNRNFTYLLIGNFLRRSCFVLFSLQIIWFTVELTNQSSLKLSMMVMSQTLPFIIFGISVAHILINIIKRKYFIYLILY